jgi:enoyl-CoA hydratase/carnithine racemase
MNRSPTTKESGMTDQPEGFDGWKHWREWETLTLETNEAFPEIGLLTLNRPEKLNAVSVAMMADLHGCLDFLNHAFDCRVLVIRGAGKLFCSGVDLTTRPEEDQELDWAEFPEKVKTSWQIQHELSSVIARLRRIPQPVIAAVHRAAVGVGMAIANASDIVVASKGTRFLNAFIKIGFSGADCGSSYFLPRLLGFHRSAELLYSGRDLSAEEAHAWGYVNFLVEKDEEVVARAVDFAAEYMLTRSPLGLRLTKEALNYNMDIGGVEAAIKLEDRNQVLCGETQDAVEGVTAFFEKRRPNYGSR